MARSARAAAVTRARATRAAARSPPTARVAQSKSAISASGPSRVSARGARGLLETGAGAGDEVGRQRAERGAHRHHLRAQEARLFQRLAAQEGAPGLLGEVAQRRAVAGASARGERLRGQQLALGLGDGIFEGARGAGAGDGAPGVCGLAVEGARVVPAQVGVGGRGARVGLAGEGALERGADVLAGHRGDRPPGRGGDCARDEGQGDERREHGAMLARAARRAARS